MRGAAISSGKMFSVLIRLISFFSSAVGGYFIFTLKTLALFPLRRNGLVSFGIESSTSSSSSRIGFSGSSISPTTSVVFVFSFCLCLLFFVILRLLLLLLLRLLFRLLLALAAVPR